MIDLPLQEEGDERAWREANEELELKITEVIKKCHALGLPDEDVLWLCVATGVDCEAIIPSMVKRRKGRA